MKGYQMKKNIENEFTGKRKSAKNLFSLTVKFLNFKSFNICTYSNFQLNNDISATTSICCENICGYLRIFLLGHICSQFSSSYVLGKLYASRSR